MTSAVTISAPIVQPGVGTSGVAAVEVRYAGQRVRVPVRWVGSIDEPPLAWRLAQPIGELVEALGLD